MGEEKQRVVVLGASPKRDRYSNQAVRLLVERGHDVVPVHPTADFIEGLKAFHDLSDIEGHVDTLTVYVSAARSSPLQDDILELRPDRVIFNPGAENPALRESLEQHGIRSKEACTLVLLRTGQF